MKREEVYSANNFNLQTLDRSLYKNYKAGKITLHDMAGELYRCGWSPTVDVDFARRIIDNFDNEI